MMQLATVTNPRRMRVRPTEHSRLQADIARFYHRRKSSSLWLPPEIREVDRAEMAPYAGAWAGHQFGKAVINPNTIAAKHGATLGMWVRLDLGTVLSGNLYQTAGATTGPVVAAFGGANAVASPVVQFQTSGILGASTFRYGVVSGTWIESNIPTATSVALKGPLNGVGLSFPAGSYVNDFVYQGLASGNPDQTGNGNDLANTDYTTTPFLNTEGIYAGVPSMRTGPDPTNRRFIKNTTIGTPIAGNDVAWTIWTDTKVESNAVAGPVLWSFGHFSTNAKDFHELQYSNTGIWLNNRDDDAGALKQRNTGAATANLVRHWHKIPFTGTQITFTQDGSILALTGTDMNTGNILISQFTFGGRNGASTTALIDASCAEIVWMLGVPSAGFQTDMDAYFASGRARFR